MTVSRFTTAVTAVFVSGLGELEPTPQPPSAYCEILGGLVVRIMKEGVGDTITLCAGCIFQRHERASVPGSVRASTLWYEYFHYQRKASQDPLCRASSACFHFKHGTQCCQPTGVLML